MRISVANVSLLKGGNPFKYEFATRWNRFCIANADKIHGASFGELMTEALGIFIKMVDEDVRSIEVAGGSLEEQGTIEAPAVHEAEVQTKRTADRQEGAEEGLDDGA